MSAAGDIYRSFVSSFPTPSDGDLRVWWIPQIPMKAFEWPVSNIEHAAILIDALAAYDDFQFANRVKGDYANAGGLLIFMGGAWEEWESDDGDDFDTYRHLRSATDDNAQVTADAVPATTPLS